MAVFFQPRENPELGYMIAEASLFGRTLSHVIVTIGDAAFGLGLAWMGYALWSAKREPAS